MPVLAMQKQETSWDDTAIMMTNGEDLVGYGRQAAAATGDTATLRTQDDARVSYFTRPQDELNEQYGLHQALTVSEIEREFHRMSFDTAEDKDSRNLWDKGGGPVGDRSKAMFASLRANNPWMSQEENWVTPTKDALNELMTGTRRRPGSFPGTSEIPPAMSPNLADTSSLGINMAEYVLGPSPLGKNLENRLGGMHRYVGGGDADNGKLPVDMFSVDGKQDHDQDTLHMNGTLQNGLDEKGYGRAPGSRQSSPTSVEATSNGTQLKQSASISESLLQSCQPSSLPLTGMAMNSLSLDVPSYEMMGYDPFQNHYGNHLLAPPHIPPPTMNSPNFGVDYNRQMLQARQQQGEIELMPPHPQQFALPSDQMLGMTTYASPAACVLNSQDAFGVGMSAPGAAMMTQYYGMTPSWPVYPTGTILQQQQQQQLQQQQQAPMTNTASHQPPILRNQSTRPVTPQQPMHDSTTMQNTGGSAAGYQILAAPAYYDQNGQLLMNGGRGIGQLVRLVSPAPLMMNATPGQQGYTPQGNIYTPAVSGGMFNPRNNTPSVWLNPQQPGYGGGHVGSSFTQGNIGSGGIQQQQMSEHLSDHLRRDSFGSQDLKQQPPLTNFASQYYGAGMSPGGGIGLLAAGPAAMTPPPTLSLSNSIPLNGLNLGSGGRLYSVAPGAETKFRSGSASSGSGGALFGASLFNAQPFMKSDGILKDGIARSQLLEDFRGNHIPNLQLRDLTNHVVEFSQDQHGSRFIQQKLEHATATEKTMVFNEILGSAYVLMTDVFGNYVIQKFFEFGSQEQRQSLAQRVRGHVLTLALHMYGCRVIQKALESITSDLQVEIVNELNGSILKCVKDQNGNHVVQKCIECIDAKHLGFITDAFKGQVLTLAMHPYGCRVIQRILEHCTSDQVKPIMDELLQCTEHLVHDQYGNYVVQHILEHGQPDDKTKIINKLRGKMMVLSQHKFASNVVEKCVSHSSRAERASIIEEVCTMIDGPQSALYSMMKDQFANYVVQKMIDLAEPPQRKLLLQKIRPHISILRRYAYGKHILAKLEKFYSKNSADLGPIGVVPSSAVQ